MLTNDDVKNLVSELSGVLADERFGYINKQEALRRVASLVKEAQDEIREDEIPFYAPEPQPAPKLREFTAAPYKEQSLRERELDVERQYAEYYAKLDGKHI